MNSRSRCFSLPLKMFSSPGQKLKQTRHPKKPEPRDKLLRLKISKRGQNTPTSSNLACRQLFRTKSLTFDTPWAFDPSWTTIPAYSIDTFWSLWKIPVWTDGFHIQLIKITSEAHGLSFPEILTKRLRHLMTKCLLSFRTLRDSHGTSKKRPIM